MSFESRDRLGRQGLVPSEQQTPDKVPAGHKYLSAETEADGKTQIDSPDILGFAVESGLHFPIKSELLGKRVKSLIGSSRGACSLYPGSLLDLAELVPST